MKILSIFTKIFIFLTLGLLFSISVNSQETIKHNSSHVSPETQIQKKTVAILLYDGALILDYGIAAEMFLAANLSNSFEVFTVSENQTANLSILGETSTDHSFQNAPKADVIIVPGGMFWPQMGENLSLIKYLRSAQNEGTILFSICTGSLLLAKAGFLDGVEATTNLRAQNMLTNLAPTSIPVEGAVFVDAGKIVTAAGSGTAIEATLHLIERLVGEEIAEDLRTGYLDYPHEGYHPSHKIIEGDFE